MIGNVSRSKSFSSTVRYVLGEAKKAKVVFGNFAQALQPKIDCDLIIKQFNDRAAFNQRVKKPVYHLSISPAVNDELTDTDWSELADKMLKSLDLNNNQAIGVLHQDTYFPNSQKVRKHLHLVVNAVDYRSKCANFYYDYYRIENCLRTFEQERNLTSVQNNQDNFKEINKTMVQSQDRQVDLNKSEGIGNLLAHQLNQLDDLDRCAKEIKTSESIIDGYDIISSSIVSASSLGKLTLAFISLCEEKKVEEKLALETIHGLSTALCEIKQEDSLVTEAVNIRVELIEEKHLPQFIEDATKYLEKETKLLTGYSNSSNTQSNLRLAGVREEILQRLELPGDLHQKFVGNFRAINSLSNKPDSEEYSVKAKIGDIYISNKPNNKEVKIGSKKYHAVFHDNKWQEITNNLTFQEISSIQNLPQTEEALTQEYAGRQIAKYLLQEFQSKDVKQAIYWQYAADKSKDNQYEFSYNCGNERGNVSIQGKDRNNRQIFAAEVLDNSLIRITLNDIPVKHLKDFVNWQKANAQNRQRKNSKNHPRQL